MQPNEPQPTKLRHRRVLVVDDMRERFDTLCTLGVVPDDAKWVTCAGDAMEAFQTPWEEVWMDFDLATWVNGAEVVRVMLQQPWQPRRVFVHTVNETGAKAILDLLGQAGIPTVRVPFTDFETKGAAAIHGATLYNFTH